MQFSIWDYLKERARKATLAGVAEALDELEGENSEMSHEAAADRLRARLSGQVVRPLPEPQEVTTEQPAGPVPAATVPVAEPNTGHVNGRATIPPSLQSRRFGEGIEPTAAPPRIPTRAPATKPDPFEERLNGALPKPRPEPTPKQQAAPQDRRGPSRNGHAPALPEFDPPPAPKPEAPERRKRGRPRKDEG